MASMADVAVNSVILIEWLPLVGVLGVGGVYRSGHASGRAGARPPCPGAEPIAERRLSGPGMQQRRPPAADRRCRCNRRADQASGPAATPREDRAGSASNGGKVRVGVGDVGGTLTAARTLARSAQAVADFYS